jgi:hypothetical protein
VFHRQLVAGLLGWAFVSDYWAFQEATSANSRRHDGSMCGYLGLYALAVAWVVNRRRQKLSPRRGQGYDVVVRSRSDRGRHLAR